jgi:hypothetical protein
VRRKGKKYLFFVHKSCALRRTKICLYGAPIFAHLALKIVAFRAHEITTVLVIKFVRRKGKKFVRRKGRGLCAVKAAHLALSLCGLIRKQVKNLIYFPLRRTKSWLYGARKS